MRIAILGTGVVGKALGQGFITLGHDVKMGSRDAKNEKALAWAKEMGATASTGTFADAAAFGEIVVLADARRRQRERASPPPVRGIFAAKILDRHDQSARCSEPALPGSPIAGNDSGGERVQRLVPDALVVKAFNTVGAPHMFRPTFPGGPPDMFICGNDAGAQQAGGERYSATSAGASSTSAESKLRATSKRCASLGFGRASTAATGTWLSSC